jgi:prepilin-type N-terminal cleavage/methylation domain-containing protein
MIQRSLKKKRSGEGGFTLVELLIVIVILGILAAIVVLAIGGLKGTSEKAACKSGAQTIESAQDAFFAVSADDTVVPAVANHYGTVDDLLSTTGAAGKVLKKDPRPGLTVTANTTTGYNIVGSGTCASYGTQAKP